MEIIKDLKSYLFEKINLLTSEKEIIVDMYMFNQASMRKIPKNYTGKINFINGNFIDDKVWHFKDGKLHREDGPAIINPFINFDGIILCYFPMEHHRYFIRGQSYFLNGKCYPTKEDWFNDMNEEQQTKALFNLSEWR